MNIDEVRYCIDNYEKINEKIDEIMDTLSEDEGERLSDLFDSGKIEEVYSIINNASMDSEITLLSLKIIHFLNYLELDEKLFSNDEKEVIFKGFIDKYDEQISNIMSISELNISDLDFLLSLDESKYFKIYQSILLKKLKSVSKVEEAIEILEESNASVVDKELIVDFLKQNHHIVNAKLLKKLPTTMLADGTIAKTMIEKMYYINSDDIEILSYIPLDAFTPQLVDMIVDKSKHIINESFNYIPDKFKTRKIWEKACDYDIRYINQIPNNNIDTNITQEEYASWLENLIIKKIADSDDVSRQVIYFLEKLSNEKKTISTCQKIVEFISNDANVYDNYKTIIDQIPKSSMTQKLCETLVSKTPMFLKYIPLESPESGITQEKYEEWLENLILQCITNSDDMKVLINSISREQINERIWNAWLDKCIERKVDKEMFPSISMVSLKNLTQQMIERSLQLNPDDELRHIPWIDKKLENINPDIKDEFVKWQTSFTEEEKQAYRIWYERTLINTIKAFPHKQLAGIVYEQLPKEVRTIDIIKIAIDTNIGKAISMMSIPETPEQLHIYQQALIYAINKEIGVDYKTKKTALLHEDILSLVPREYIGEEVIRVAIEKSILYLNYANPNAENFNELLNIAFKNKLASIGRTELTEKEQELMKKFALNNADLFKTLQLEILDPKIVAAIGEASLEKIVRYFEIQVSLIKISENDSALKIFAFVLNNLRTDNSFIEPLIEKLATNIVNACSSIGVEKSFLNLVSTRIDMKDMPLNDYEKTIISYLALNWKEMKKIASYNDIMTFVERKNAESEKIINNEYSTLFEVKNAYLERTIGLNYEAVVKLIAKYGNDPEQLLHNYQNINLESFSELGEKEALEIIIKLKSLIETQDIYAIKSEFQKIISQEENEPAFMRYQKATILENTIKRAYGREIVASLSKNIDSLETQELELEGEKYLVRKVTGEFTRMVSLLGAYHEPTVTEGDFYDRWNTNQMASNHALCYSLINQSNPGTAKTANKTGIVIAISDFSPESIVAEAPYDLRSENNKNISITRQQQFFSSINMPNQTRGYYSEYVIEIHDVLSKSEEYKKIQPAAIVCFEEVDKDSIRAAIELGKKMGHPIPIELIDRRELAKNEMSYIIEAFNKFKNNETINLNLIEEIITRFNNVRNAHRISSLSDEILGEKLKKENNQAPFNKQNLNQMLKECLANIEKRICSGQVEEGLKALEGIKAIILKEREKMPLFSSMYYKQPHSGIDIDIDYIIDELQRNYGKTVVKPLEKIKTLEALFAMRGQDLSSITLNSEIHCQDVVIPEQLSVDQIIQITDVKKIQECIAEIHSGGYYQGNKFYDEEHIARVILYSDIISKMENFDEKTKKLLIEAAKYYSCGRQLDIDEPHEQYSAKLAGKALMEKYSESELKIIQVAIEMQSFKSSTFLPSDVESKRKEKLIELCSKYTINEDEAIIVSKIASCVSDAIVLDQTRFVDKAQNEEPGKSFSVENINYESAKKLVEFSYLMQERLAQQTLDILKTNLLANEPIDNLDYNIRTEIMQTFFTKFSFSGGHIETKEITILESPIVKLEYFKYKHPEISNIDLDLLSKRKQVIRTIILDQIMHQKNPELQTSCTKKSNN